MQEIIKICKKCGPLQEHQIRREKNGIHIKISCLACRRKANILNKRNITEKEYDDFILKQNNKCAICSKEEIMLGRSRSLIPLAVDHCHFCNINRGLLCSDCNTAIGKAKDNPDLLQKAITYLQKHKHVVS